MTAPVEVRAFNEALLRADLDAAISVDYPEDRMAEPSDLAHIRVEDEGGNTVFAVDCKAFMIGSWLGYLTVLIDGGILT